MKNKITSFIFILLIILSIGLVIFTKFNDNLYKEQIMIIKKIELNSTTSNSNPLGIEEEYKEQTIMGVITNGENRGLEKVLTYEERYSSIITEKYKVGDKVFLNGNNIEGLKRDTYVAIMISIFIISIYAVGKFKGLLAVITVIFNLSIFYLGLNLYINGMNLLFVTLTQAVIFTVFSLFVVSGINKKTLSAIISTLISLIILACMTILITNITNYKGINFNEMSFLTVPIEDVLLAELVLGGLGAIMDISITMSSSIAELINKNNHITKKELLKSGKEIGNDIMGSMTNVLFFTYLCSGLPVFVLAFRNGFTFYNYITTNFTLEITRFLIGSIGITLTIPIALIIATKIFKRGEVNE